MVSPVRARGILGMAIAWGVGLAGLATSLLVSGVLLDVVPSSVYGIRELVAVAVRGLAVGGAAGALFAVVLARQERKTTFASLRSGRVAAWGFVGSAGIASVLALTAPAALPALVLVPAILLAGALGAGASVSVLTLARRADAKLRPIDAAPPSSLPPAI